MIVGNSKPKIIKVRKCKTLEDLKEAFKEFRAMNIRFYVVVSKKLKEDILIHCSKFDKSSSIYFYDKVSVFNEPEFLNKNNDVYALVCEINFPKPPTKPHINSPIKIWGI